MESRGYILDSIRKWQKLIFSLYMIGDAHFAIIKELNYNLMVKSIKKRNYKDNLFRLLFTEERYSKELAVFLGEKSNVNVDEGCTNATISNIFTNGLYNDIAYLFGNRLLMLAEAQSTFTSNILPRLAMYYFETVKRMSEKEKWNIYKRNRLSSHELIRGMKVGL